MYKLLFTLFSFMLSALSAESQTILQGQVTDDKEPLVGALVILLQQGALVKDAITDMNGNYLIQVDSGSYDIEVAYTGYNKQRIEKVNVLPGINFLNIQLDGGLYEDNYVVFCGWRPLINIDATESGQTFTSTQIRHMY